MGGKAGIFIKINSDSSLYLVADNIEGRRNNRVCLEAD